MHSVTRRPGTTAPVTVEIERFPDTPQGHTGYAPVKSSSAPTRTGRAFTEFSPFCQRGLHYAPSFVIR